jgi:carbon monoxide dehydrogenase subunit G
MGMNLSGTITVLSQDADAGEAHFLVEANDRRVGGGVKTNMSMKVIAKSADETGLEIMADTTFMGRLAELGQPLIRRKARNTVEDFSKNLSKLLASTPE